MTRIKEDIIIEVGLSLLLVDDSYKEIDIIQSFIHNKVDLQKNMILSESGKSNISQGQHRNIIAVLLLDWRGCSTVPSYKEIGKLSGLISKQLEQNI